MSTPPIEAILHAWQGRKIPARYFLGDPRLSLKLEDYTTRGMLAGEPATHTILTMDLSATPYGVVLQAPRDQRTLDVAVLGFAVNERVADCLHIQGAHGRYRELSPLRWDGALLDSLIVIAQEGSLDAVHVLPAALVSGMDARNAERLYRRYDENAQRHGFKRSHELHRYVRELHHG